MAHAVVELATLSYQASPRENITSEEHTIEGVPRNAFAAMFLMKLVAKRIPRSACVPSVRETVQAAQILHLRFPHIQIS